MSFFDGLPSRSAIIIILEGVCNGSVVARGARLLGAFLALITFHRAKHESRNSVFYNYCQLVVVFVLEVRVANIQWGVGEDT